VVNKTAGGVIPDNMVLREALVRNPAKIRLEEEGEDSATDSGCAYDARTPPAVSAGKEDAEGQLPLQQDMSYDEKPKQWQVERERLRIRVSSSEEKETCAVVMFTVTLVYSTGCP
jgi:hypothetical protein